MGHVLVWMMKAVRWFAMKGLIIVRSQEFRAEVARLVRSGGSGFNAKLKASRGLVEGLVDYSVNYICRYDQSPILKKAQGYIFELDSANPIKVQSSASQARNLYIDYVRQGPSSPLIFEVVMLQMVINGLFMVNPGMRREAQEALSGGLEMIWSLLDDGYVFGQGLYGSDTHLAEAKMQELFACAEINTGLSYC